ncbi:MAG: YbaB/EbfC family nucleoid-associated protein [Treponema sp.]
MNLLDAFKNIGQVQNQIKEVKEKLKNVEVTGTSGAGLVKVTLNGAFALTSIELDPIAVDNRDVKMLQDLIVSAHYDAMQKLEEKMQEELGPFAQGFLNA